MFKRTFTWAEQKAFADLSGDFNPLHMDAQASRRLLFGMPVVHGIHIFLWALDCFAVEHAGLLGLTHLEAQFDVPVALGEFVTLQSSKSGERQVKLVATVANGTALTAYVDYKSTSGEQSIPWLDLEALPKASCNVYNEEQFNHAHGCLALTLSQGHLAHLFPALARIWILEQIAIILATTRLVGMECPGLHSLYSGLELSFVLPRQDTKQAQRGSKPSLGYRVAKWAPRYRLLDMALEVKGIAMGMLYCLVRPAPVDQPSYAEVVRRVPPNTFSGQTALIVGGSRGLGEVTAKLIAAGGGASWVTYRSGRSEAQALVDEITSGGGLSQALFLDVLDSGKSIDMDTLRTITHFYFFASPRINATRGNVFDGTLFENYCRYYVDGVRNVLVRFLPFACSQFTFFYPSTIFLDDPDPRFLEYMRAKQASETLCKQLQNEHPDARFVYRRLPRMRTDQTQGLIPAALQDPLEVIYKELRRMNSSYKPV